jgi:hypothetical protein
VQSHVGASRPPWRIYRSFVLSPSASFSSSKFSDTSAVTSPTASALLLSRLTRYFLANIRRLARWFDNICSLARRPQPNYRAGRSLEHSSPFPFLPPFALRRHSLIVLNRSPIATLPRLAHLSKKTLLLVLGCQLCSCQLCMVEWNRRMGRKGIRFPKFDRVSTEMIYKNQSEIENNPFRLPRRLLWQALCLQRASR